MNKKDAGELAHCIDMEGFDYTFTCYSDWKEVKDRKFQRLREAYVKAAAALEKYVEKCNQEESE
jgi:hypothetical protein